MVVGDNVCCLAPSEIRFSQDTIAATFQNGDSVNELINEIGCGYLKVEDIPTIKVKRVDKKYYSLDNRRLYVFRVLQKQGKINSISVRLVNRLPEVKWTTNNDGRSVKVRGDQTLPHTLTSQTRSEISAADDRNYRNSFLGSNQGNTSTKLETTSQPDIPVETGIVSSARACDETLYNDDVNYYYNDSELYQSYQTCHFDYKVHHDENYINKDDDSSRKDSSDSGGWSFNVKLMAGLGVLALAWYLLSKSNKQTTDAPSAPKIAK